MEEKQTIVALGAGSITKKVTRKVSEDGSESVLIERCENVSEIIGTLLFAPFKQDFNSLAKFVKLG